MEWEKIAEQRVLLFERQFGDGYRSLACFASLPLVLTPELVHYLRVEFLLDQVAWEAEADLLLSDLCSQVGYELYAMDSGVRSYLLKELKQSAGDAQMARVARVLMSYVVSMSRMSPGVRVREMEAQRWAAMGYLGDASCGQMVDEIKEQFARSVREGSGTALKAEFARLSQITAELALQLGEYSELVEFAQAVGLSLRSPQQLTSEQRSLRLQVGDQSVGLPGVKVDEGLVLWTFEFEGVEFGDVGIARERVQARSLIQVPHEFQVATIDVIFKQTPKRFWQRSQPEPTPTIQIKKVPKREVYYVENLAEGLELELVKIPAGSFQMGSLENELESYSDERPRHKVSVPEFLMGKVAVTQAQWRFGAGLPEVDRSIDADPSEFKGEDRPVEQVSWLEAVEFCNRLSKFTGREYGLPSEAQWEYACRAGTSTPFHFGETIDAEVANYCAEDRTIKDNFYPGKYAGGRLGEYRKQTTAVESFGVANEFGLYDMHGNVWEWCADHWHESYEDAPKDASAWLDQNASEDAERLLRGGSWDSHPRYCRAAFRARLAADVRNYSLGFRLISSTRILA